MFVIYYADLGPIVSHWDHMTECGELECTVSYWMVPGTVQS